MSKTAAKKTEGATLFGKLPETPPAKTKAPAKVRPAVEGDPTRPKNAIATIQPVNPRNMLGVLLQAASDPKVDVPKMQAILAMQKEMVAEQARLDYTVAMRELKRKLPTINKDGRIEFKDKGHGKAMLRFASFENIHDVIRPLLDEFGFDLWFSSEPGVAGMINVVGNLEHEGGHARRTVLPMPNDNSGGKSGAQGWASAFSFGKRIAVIGMLNIRTAAPDDRDVDGNAAKRTKAGRPQVVDGDVVLENGVATTEVCSEDQLVKVRDAIEGCGVSDKNFCSHFRIEKVSQLPLAEYENALAACKNYEERK